jgi:hypothetical protein
MWFNDAAPAFEREIGSRLGLTAFGSAVLVLPVIPLFIGALISAAQAAAASLF